MVSEQICPSCSTPNSSFAPSCRSCGASLSPRSLPGDATDYEPAPRNLGLGNGIGGAEGWPAEKLTPSSLTARYQADRWAGVPRHQGEDQGPPEPSLWPRSALEAQERPAPGRTTIPTGLGAAPSAPPPPRGPLSFHLDVGAGTALAAGQHPPTAPPRPPASAPAVPSLPLPAPGQPDGSSEPAAAAAAVAVADPEPAEAPDGSDPGSGGRGWGIREPRQAPVSAFAMPVAAAYAGAYPGGVGEPAGYPQLGFPAPGAAIPRAGQAARGSRILPVLLALLLLVMLSFAGGLWFFTYGPGGTPKLHTVSAPTVLEGMTKDTSSQATALAAQIQARYAQDINIAGSAVAFYGDASGFYFLDLQAGKRVLTLSDLTTDVGRGEPNFDFSTATVTTAGGVTFYCGADTLVGGSFLCTWIDGNVQGEVIGGVAGGAAATLAAAEQARATAEH